MNIAGRKGDTDVSYVGTTENRLRKHTAVKVGDEIAALVLDSNPYYLTVAFTRGRGRMFSTWLPITWEHKEQWAWWQGVLVDYIDEYEGRAAVLGYPPDGHYTLVIHACEACGGTGSHTHHTETCPVGCDTEKCATCSGHSRVWKTKEVKYDLDPDHFTDHRLTSGLIGHVTETIYRIDEDEAPGPVKE